MIFSDLVSGLERVADHATNIAFSILDEDPEDLISIGTIGLIKAVVTFNADKGNRLAAYASKCIENEILMYLRSKKKSNKEVSLYEPIGTDVRE